MENSRNQQEKKDWSKKGLGWLPDYPDLRDYNLGNEEGITNNLIKIEERTHNFEQSVNNLIDVISKIADKIGDDSSIKNTVEELRTQIFGNVRFAKVKVYKILRYISENPDKTDDIPPANPSPYESLLSKQILDLKQYLSSINLSMNANERKKLDINWMRNPVYDEYTKSLVKNLQDCLKIKSDGIVGIETYNALNEYFYKENDSKNKKILESQNDRRNQSIIYAKSSSEVNFVAISSLITINEFKIILKILKNKVIEQIDHEFHNEFPKDKNNDFDSLTPQNKKERVNTFVENFFEYKFLEAIEISIKLEFQNLFKLTQDDFNQITQNNELKDLIIKIVEEINNIVKEINNTSSPSSKILEALQNSSVTRPIFSVITRTFSPLSQYSNQTWEEMITKGFNNLDKPADLNPEPGYSQEKLISTAISQVTSLLQKEIEKNKANTSALFICFLLKKYLNRLKEKHMKDVKIDIKNNEYKSNIFDNQEVFKIEQFLGYDNNIEQSKETETNKPKDLFTSLNLHIPIIINNSYLKNSRTSIKEEESLETLFFYLPAVIDLSFWFSPVRDQGSLKSCTAFAAISLLEYFQNRNFGKSIDASPLFLYKAARNKMHVEGDVGSSIRETIKVMALFGVPPEEYWPYEEDKVDEEPPPYCYAYAQNYKTLKYFLLDYPGITTESLLFQVKAVLAAGFPCIFGLTLYTSAYEETNSDKGYIPYPDSDKDKVVGGHTAVVVGYDDYKFIRCANRQHYSKGAFLIRNSWGTEWGVNGYGWLPYDYVLAGLTAAWWSLLKAEWFDESNFGSARTGGKNRNDGRPGNTGSSSSGSGSSGSGSSDSSSSGRGSSGNG